MVFISRLSVSKRIALPWLTWRVTSRHASTPFNTSARLNSVSAEPESAVDKNPHMAVLAVRT